jgi:hypothetical protein
MRNGPHSTVYDVQLTAALFKDVLVDESTKRFPFVTGKHYKGEWSKGKKEGYGVQVGVDGTKYEVRG